MYTFITGFCFEVHVVEVLVAVQFIVMFVVSVLNISFYFFPPSIVHLLYEFNLLSDLNAILDYSRHSTLSVIPILWNLIALLALFCSDVPCVKLVPLAITFSY